MATSRSLVDRSIWKMAPAAVVLCVVLSHAACVRSPSAPSSAASLLGTWAGTVTGEGTGTGALTLTIASEYGVPPLTRVAGVWTAVFPDNRFSGQGTLSGGPNGATQVVLNFSGMVVACPGQPGGIAAKTPIITLQRDDRRMSGPYVVLDCLGGEMSISRQ